MIERTGTRNPSAANWLTLALALVGAASAPVFHAFEVRCWIYLPAHVAPLLAGLLLGARRGLLVGAAVAVADLLVGGRLEGPRAYAVMTELVTYGLVAGSLRREPATIFTHLRALVGAMLAGRLSYLIWSLAMGRALVRSLGGLFLTPWPGIAFQLLTLPALALLIERWVSMSRARSTKGIP